MDIEILYKPSYSLGMINLKGGEDVMVEGGAMVSMSPGVTLETKAAGGILKSLGRSLFSGESFFMNTYTAPPQGGHVSVAPALPGDLFSLDLMGEDLLVQSGSYVASEMGIELNQKWGGAKMFFASESVIMLKTSGTGKILLSSYGAIHEVNLTAGEEYTVDTGHLVAFTEGMGFDVKKVGGLKSTLFSGEGFVVGLTGPGRVLLQTRSSQAFLAWLIPQLPRSPGGK